jgi:hypothetical protein
MRSETSVTTVERGTAPVTLWIAIAVLALVSITLTAFYVQANHDLEAQKATVAGLQLEIAKEVSHAAELKSDLNAVRTDALSLATKAEQLKSEVEGKNEALVAEKSKTESVQAALDHEKARSPTLPVRIQMRPSAMGRGLVAMLTNTSERQLSVLMATRNPTTQAVKHLSLQVAPGAKVEIGFREGVQFASGDQVRLRSAGFEDLAYTVQ